MKTGSWLLFSLNLTDFFFGNLKFNLSHQSIQFFYNDDDDYDSSRIKTFTSRRSKDIHLFCCHTFTFHIRFFLFDLFV